MADFGAVASVVCELPQVYPHSKVDPNDLVRLAVRVGELKALAEHMGATVTLVLPRQWKGSVPKTIHGRRIQGQLSPWERGIYSAVPCAASKRHNVLDAIGLGIWFLQRKGKR